MKKYTRILDLKPILKRKSIFLFGPRQTGKTTYLKTQFPQALYIDLLDLEKFRELNRKPSLLSSWIQQKKAKLVILDEIQKLPELLSEVHRLIEADKNLRFILTGSSARKLKGQGVNLLGGRATEVHLHPLSLKEIDGQNTLNNVLKFGTLPSVLLSSEPRLDLKDYVNLYLQQEVREEALVKNFSNFSRFIDFAAATNAEVLNFTSLGSDAQISPRTVQDYYSILEDTLLGTILRPMRSPNRKMVTTAKFYFFDLGVCFYLRGLKVIQPKTNEYGKAFEHLVFNELRAFQSYRYDLDVKLSFWRTHNQQEVDFVLEVEDQIYAIEVKSSAKPKISDLNGLRAFQSDFPYCKPLVVCTTRENFQSDKIQFVNLKTFVELLWKLPKKIEI